MTLSNSPATPATPPRARRRKVAPRCVCPACLVIPTASPNQVFYCLAGREHVAYASGQFIAAGALLDVTFALNTFHAEALEIAAAAADLDHDVAQAAEKPASKWDQLRPAPHLFRPATIYQPTAEMYEALHISDEQADELELDQQVGEAAGDSDVLAADYAAIYEAHNQRAALAPRFSSCGYCGHCGRDNRGYEDSPCSDDCPSVELGVDWRSFCSCTDSAADGGVCDYCASAPQPAAICPYCERGQIIAQAGTDADVLASTDAEIHAANAALPEYPTFTYSRHARGFVYDDGRPEVYQTQTDAANAR